MGIGADVQLNNATILGGVLKTSGSNAIVEALDSTDDVISSAVNSAVIQVDDFATLEVQGASFVNNNTIIVAGSDFANLQIDNNLTLTGGGKVSLATPPPLRFSATMWPEASPRRPTGTVAR
jgi:hypothetical protein